MKHRPPLLLGAVSLCAYLLGGCEQASNSLEKVEAKQRAAAADSGQVICARAGSDDFARRCTLERTKDAQGLILTVRHPDGAFRRLLVTKDGRGVIAADGAEMAKVTVRSADEIEVMLGGDRYRLPATVHGATKPGQ